MAPVATGMLSRQARNLSSGVRIRKALSACFEPALARSNALAANRNMESDCSAGSAIFRSWRRSRGYSMMALPNALLVTSGGLDRADIGAAGALRHELRTLPQRRRVIREHFRQQVISEFGTCEFADEVDRGVGNADRAHQTEFGLHEKVLQCIL